MSNTDPIKLPENRDAFLVRAFAEPDGVVSAGVPIADAEVNNIEPAKLSEAEIQRMTDELMRRIRAASPTPTSSDWTKDKAKAKAHIRGLVKQYLASPDRTPVSDQTGSTTMQCDCLTWGSENIMHSLLGNGHHERCPHHVPHVGALDIIRDLVRGMEEWAHDEDGVHPEAWKAYQQAKLLLGDPF